MIGQLRTHVADQLRAGVPGVTVHEYPPEAVQPPAIVLIAGEPYLNGATLKRGSATVRLQVQCITGAKNASAMDDLLWAVAQVLSWAGAPGEGGIPPPRHDPSIGMLVARVPITVKWEG